MNPNSNRRYDEKSPPRRLGKRGRPLLLPFLVLGVLALMPSWPGAAAAAGAYAGLGLGVSNVTVAETAVAFDTGDYSASESTFRLFAGYGVGNHLRLEGGYIDLNQARVSEQAYGDFFETALTGFDLTVIGILPLGRSLSAFAKGGLLFWSADVTAEYATLDDVSRSASGSAPALGLGISYAIGGSFALRAEFVFYDIDEVEAGVDTAKPVLISGEFAF